MNPLTLVAGIFHVISKLHDAHRQIKSNVKQSGTLIKRVAALLTPLKALEAQLDREEAQRMEAEAADGGAGAGVGSTTSGTGPPLPPSSLSAASNASLVRQLSALLSLLDDAFALVSSFTAASSWSRVWSKSDYSESFLALHAALSQAQADLGFGMAVSDRAWNIQATRDAAEDLRDIKQVQTEMAEQMQQARLEQQSHATAAASAASAAAQRDASEHEFLVARFQSMSAKQDEVVRLLARLEREKTRAEQRSHEQLQPGAASTQQLVAAPAAPHSPADGILRFSLSDLELDPQPVGSGGFGDVFRAHCSSRDEIVAVKKLRVPAGSVLPPQALAEFMSELQLLHSLPRHAHIITLLGVVLDPAAGVYAMVLEWMARGSLFEYLRATPRDRLSYRDRLHLSLQVTRAVNHLHALPPPQGPVVHRDLKSLNILLDEAGAVRLADFGLARARVHSSTASVYATTALPSAGAAASTLGTLRWSAPEYLRPGGKARGTPASDVYSLAVVIWEIMTHCTPYEGESDDLIALSIRSADPADKLSIEGLPAPIAQILRACWNVDPAARPTAARVMGAIKSLLNEENARIETANAATAGEHPSASPSASSIPSSMTSAGDQLRCVSCHRLRPVALEFLQVQLRKPAGPTCNECLMAKAERECQVACCEPGAAPAGAVAAATRSAPPTIAATSAASFAVPAASPSPAAPSSPFGFSQFLLRADSHPWITPQVSQALDEIFVVTRSALEVSVYALRECRMFARPQPIRVLRPGFSRIDAIVLDRSTGGPQTLFVSGKRQASDYLVRMNPGDGSILHSAPCVYASSLALDALRSTLFCASLAKVKVFDFAANPIGEFGAQAPTTKKNAGAASAAGATPDAIGLAHQVLVLSSAQAATRVFVLDKDLHRVSVWDARNFKPLYSFGRPAAAASPSSAASNGSADAGCCTFGNWSSAALLQNGSGHPVLVISEAASRSLSVYAASGEFLGSLQAHREEKRQICADASGSAGSHCELWEVYQLSAQESAEAAAAVGSPSHGAGGALSPIGSAPVWTPDALRSACFCCGAKFTLLRRRHHCRQCKEIVCGDCSKSKTAKTAASKAERICDRCVAMRESSTPL